MARTRNSPGLVMSRLEWRYGRKKASLLKPGSCVTVGCDVIIVTVV